MSEASTEYVEAEAEAAPESEAWPFESEAAPGEAQESQYGEAYSRDRRRQMLRARQQAQQRRPLTPSRPAPVRPQPTAPQRMPRPAGPSAGQVSDIQTDVLSLDLDTKAALNRIRRDLDSADKLAYRNAWAAEASAASALTLDTFGDSLADKDWARALIIGAPTLLLAPRRKRKPGIEGIISDPRFAGALGLGLIFGIGRLTKESRESQGLHAVQLSGPSQLGAGQSVQLTASAVDGKGNKLSLPISYTVDQKAVADVDSSGKLTAAAAAAGTVRIIAESGDVSSDPIYVTVS
jgi:hypothetical protein